MATGISQQVARPVRTAAQLVPSAIITEFVDAFIHNLDDKQYAALGALLLLIFSFIQAHFEDVAGIGFLRQPNGHHVAVVNESA